jgi:2-oxoglutarate ferredoxin oxidoreductase subunit beta
MGSIDHPFNPISLALGAGATFVARTHDLDRKHMMEVFRAAHAYRGASFVEIFQNCNVFNDGAFEYATDKETKSDNLVEIEHGKPLVFGKNKDKALRLKPGKLELEVVPATTPEVLVHDETNRPLAQLLAALEPPFPTAMGVLYCNPTESYEHDVYAQDGAVPGNADLDALLNGERTWVVTDGGGGGA